MITKDDNEQHSIGYEYVNGRISQKRLPNGVCCSYEYYQGGRVKEIKHRMGNRIIDSIHYEYDVWGNTTKLERYRENLEALSGVYEYKYDRANRLVCAIKDGAKLRTYKYDIYGNRSEYSDTEKTCKYTYDELDRVHILETTNGFDESDVINGTDPRKEYREYFYDNRGNLLGISENGTLNRKFEFSVSNNLIRQEIGGISTEYKYNGFNKRITKKSLNKVVNYTVDPTKDYENLLQLSTNGVEEIFAYDKKGVVSMMSDAQDYYYLSDNLGSVLRLTGTDGNSILDYGYDEFGNNLLLNLKNTNDLKHQNKKYTVNGNIIQPFAFTGYQKSEENDYMYAQARYYDSTLGRFISKDDEAYISKAQPETHNLYNYCANNPFKYVDPTGHYTFAEGVEAHLYLQAIFLMMYGEPSPANGYAQGYVEVAIPGGSSKGNSNYGFADMVLVIGNTAEVYEIKSGNCYKYRYAKVKNPADPTGDRINLGTLVANQLGRYINNLTDSKKFNNVTEVKEGTTFNPCYYVQSVINPDKYIMYYTMPDTPGVIYYDYVDAVPEGYKTYSEEELADYKEQVKRTYFDALETLNLDGLYMYAALAMLFADEFEMPDFDIEIDPMNVLAGLLIGAATFLAFYYGAPALAALAPTALVFIIAWELLKDNCEG